MSPAYGANPIHTLSCEELVDLAEANRPLVGHIQPCLESIINMDDHYFCEFLKAYASLLKDNSIPQCGGLSQISGHNLMAHNQLYTLYIDTARILRSFTINDAKKVLIPWYAGTKLKPRHLLQRSPVPRDHGPFKDETPLETQVPVRPDPKKAQIIPSATRSGHGEARVYSHNPRPSGNLHFHWKLPWTPSGTENSRQVRTVLPQMPQERDEQGTFILID